MKCLPTHMVKQLEEIEVTNIDRLEINFWDETDEIDIYFKNGFQSEQMISYPEEFAQILKK